MNSLQTRLRKFANPVQMLRSSPAGRYQFPVAPEFTHWIEEQRAWREGVAFMDQSYHMTSLFVRGRDALRLLSALGANSFVGFGRDKAKQLICCNPDGYLISDAMLLGLEDDEFNVIGRPVLPNWIQFHAETGGYDVRLERDERSLDQPNSTRKFYRYEVQGPLAMQVLNKVNQGGPLSTRFFSMGRIRIDGCEARTLAHGMGGAEGLELWGPMSEAAKVRAAIEAAGKPLGMRETGSKAYSTSSVESGWVPSPLPAIYSGESLCAYREWLPERSFEAMSSLGGSYVTDNVADYYFTPWDLDYGRHIRFDHEFIGRKALEALSTRPHRRKVTLVWDRTDILKVFGAMLEDGDMPKFLDFPAAYYSSFCFDRVSVGDRLAGVSIAPAYSANERAWLSLAVVDAEVSAPGTRVVVTWGEPDALNKGAAVKPNVERHRQMPIAATVQPWPISTVIRASYRSRT